MNKQQAIESLTTTLIDTDYLARVITYYNCTQEKEPNCTEIFKFYKETALPEAEKILYDKYKVFYKTPTTIEKSLFLKEKESPFH